MVAVHETSLQSRFQTLTRQWKRETGHLSSVADRAMHRAYQQIIGLGPAALPLIFAELQRENDDWFWALAAITGEDAIPAEARGKMNAMRAAWLVWGAEHGYI